MRAHPSVLAAVLAAAALVPAAPARATVPWETVALSSGFAPADLVVTRGDTLTLANADNTGYHDITALDYTAGGRPVFRSATIAFGQVAVVGGVESLEPGTYPYVCSVHEYMAGTITVVA